MAGLTGPVGLLERAVQYGLTIVETVTTGDLDRLTPCANWDVRTLLTHLNDSVDALCEGASTGCVGLEPNDTGEPGFDAGDPAAVLVERFRSHARQLLYSWPADGDGGHSIAVADHPMAADLVAIIGAIEVAVHGWDLSIACGRDRPIPVTLALDMLRVSPLVVDAEQRDRNLFAAPVAISPLASPSDQLIAFLGRVPDRAWT